MSNLLTLQDARDFVGRWVENGTCNTTTIDARVNEACARLLVKADWPHTLQTVRIRTDNQIFPLPRECESVRWANVENEAAGTFNQSYEFMASGAGEVQHRMDRSGYKDLIDAGMFPLMYDLPPVEEFAEDSESCVDRTLTDRWQLAAFSTAIEDVAQSITVYGNNILGNEHGANSGVSFTPGEDIKINRWQDGVEGVIAGPLSTISLSVNKYRHIISWKKPVTRGYITLYVVEPSTNYMYFLAKAHPDDTFPTWRRYKISGQYQVDDCANILCLVKMKAIKLTRPDDILPIQNLYAIKLMMMAIRAENATDIQNAVAYEASATRLLAEQLKNHSVAGGHPVIIDFEPEIAAARVNQSPL